jgi:hypothetical protein
MTRLPTRSRVVAHAAAVRAAIGASWGPKKSGAKWSRIKKVE